jgi:GntR family transcriptional regulator, transcriptional repressor for pyruvate dehydrogenase complex
VWHATPLSPASESTSQDRLPQRVKDRILQLIATGALQRGDQLPPERELASKFGVSRNVVREAIQSLTAMNILYARQRSGIYVSELDPRSLIEPLAFAVSLERSSLHQLLEARLLIEPPLTYLATIRGIDEDVSRLEVLARASSCAQDDPARFLRLDAEIHDLIVRMAANPFLERTMETLGHLARSAREFTNLDPRMRAAAAADHHAILQALRRRDGREAETAMRRHLENVQRALAGSLPAASSRSN